jgi:hypothetical protein
LFRATLKKAPVATGDDGDDWESVDEDDVEADFPHVKLEELMENLKIDSGNQSEESN